MRSDSDPLASVEDTEFIPAEGETRPLRHAKMVGRPLATQFNKDVHTLYDAFKLAVETFSKEVPSPPLTNL